MPRSLLIVPFSLCLLSLAACSYEVPNRCAPSHPSQITTTLSPAWKKYIDVHILHTSTETNGTRIDTPNLLGNPTISMMLMVHNASAAPTSFSLHFQSRAADNSPPIDLSITYDLNPGELRQITEIIPLPTGTLPASVTLSLEDLVVDNVPQKLPPEKIATIDNIRPGINDPFDTCYCSRSPSDFQINATHITRDNTGRYFQLTVANLTDADHAIVLATTVTDIRFAKHKQPNGDSLSSQPALSFNHDSYQRLITFVPAHQTSTLTIPLPVDVYTDTPILLFTAAEIPQQNADLNDPHIRGQISLTAWGWWNLKKYANTLSLTRMIAPANRPPEPMASAIKK